jgi:nucleoid-associated protein YgaU
MQPATSAPGQPASPAGAASAPSFDVVWVGPNGNAVIAGRAEPGAKVTVLDGGKTVGEVTADARGEWVLTPENPLGSGNHELSLAARAKDGTTQKSDGIVAMVVPETGKAVASAATPQPRATQQPTGSAAQQHVASGTPQSTMPASAAPIPVGPAGQTLAVLIPENAPARVLQGPAGTASGAMPSVLVDVIQYDGAGHPTFIGRAAADGHVQLYLRNKSIGESQVDTKGAWSLKPEMTVPVGHYTLRADLVGDDGKVVARTLLQFKRIDVPDSLVGNQFLVVQPGNTLWRIARRTYGNGVQFTEIYAANRNEIADPNLIYADQVVTLPQP